MLKIKHTDRVGTSRTLIEQPGVAAPTVGQSTAFHTFLRLVQPIEPADYPDPRVLEAGKEYRFPFTFVVPEQLLPYACSHDAVHPQIKSNHTRLPPSLGDPMVAGDGSGLLDDLAPEMVQIQYGVRVRLSKASPTDGDMVTLLERSKKVRIVPASEEHAPLDVLDDSQEYRMRREKDVRKGSLRGKLGRLVMTAAQPRPFRLPKISKQDEQQPATTAATVHLRFDPVDDSQQPPRLGTLWSKLKVNTWYATVPWADAPSKTNSLAWSNDRGMYSRTVCLATRCVASATWKKHTGNTPQTSPSPSAAPSRRGSIQSDCSVASDLSSTSSLYNPYTASASYTGKTYYTASVVVPVTLPPGKAFVPTFHSCLSARTYALDLCLSYHTPSTSLTAPQISIRVPVQIMGPGTLLDQSHIYETSAQQADEYFVPRTITAPRPEYTQRANLGRARSVSISTASVSSGGGVAASPPPEYSSFGRVSSRQAVRGTC